jgi:RimJ/RimL family protein N-acetyltransferase
VNDWQALLRRYKTSYATDPGSLSISAHTKVGESVRLRPLQANDDSIPDADIQRLCEWRNRNPRAFLTDLEASLESTRRYATQVIGGAVDRILFFVEDERGRAFGHVGLDHIDPVRSYAELDNIVRGDSGPAGAMRAAVEAMCGWAERELGISDFWVHVIGDNPAVGFYEHLGFRRMNILPLRPVEEPGGVRRWVPMTTPPAGTEAGTRQLLIMERPAA